MRLSVCIFLSVINLRKARFFYMLIYRIFSDLRSGDKKTSGNDQSTVLQNKQ